MFSELALSLLWFLLLALFFIAAPAWAHQASTLGLAPPQRELEQTRSRYTIVDLLVFTACVALAILVFRYRDPKTAMTYGPLMAIPPIAPLFICNSAIMRCNKLSLQSWRKRFLYEVFIFPVMTISMAILVVSVPLGLTAAAGVRDANTYTQRASWYMLLLVGGGLFGAAIGIPFVRHLLRRYYGFEPNGG